MKPFTIAALCAGLAAAPLIAKAADLVLYDGAGRPVAVLVSTAEPTALPAFPAGLFTEQDAILDRMMQNMRTMQAAFSSGTMPMLPAALGSQPGSTVVMTSFTDGRSSCSRTVTYEQRGSGAPVVQVRQTGDACGGLPAMREGATLPVAAPEPAPKLRAPDPLAPEEIVPAPTSRSPQLIRVDYRHPVNKPAVHHG